MLRGLFDFSSSFVEHWLRAIRDVHYNNQDKLNDLDHEQKRRKLVELNAIQSAANVFKTAVVQEARKKRNGLPEIHAFVYDPHNGAKCVDVMCKDNASVCFCDLHSMLWCHRQAQQHSTG